MAKRLARRSKRLMLHEQDVEEEKGNVRKTSGAHTHTAHSMELVFKSNNTNDQTNENFINISAAHNIRCRCSGSYIVCDLRTFIARWLYLASTLYGYEGKPSISSLSQRKFQLFDEMISSSFFFSSFSLGLLSSHRAQEKYVKT